MLGRMYDAIEYRGFGETIADELAAWAGVPVYNGLTDEWHPTQILADFLTLREHVAKPLSETSLCYVGDARFNMADSYLVGGAKLGMDVRIASPASSGRATRSSTSHGRSRRDRRQHHDHRGRPRRVAGRMRSPPTSGSRWASRRRSGRSASAAPPYQVNAEVMAIRQPGRPVPALPAGLPQRGDEGRQDIATAGLEALEVTDEVFDRPRRSCSIRPRTGCTRSRLVLVATLELDVRVVVALGGNALLRGQTADRREPARERAHRGAALAPLATDHELVVTHGNGRRSACWRCRARRTRRSRPIPWTSSSGDRGHDRLHDRAGAGQPAAVGEGSRRCSRWSRWTPMIPRSATRPSRSAPSTPREEADRLGGRRAGRFQPDGDCVGVVPSPLPRQIPGIHQIEWLLERACVVICTGGGGIPTVRVFEPGDERGRLTGIEGVIDKDRASALLAEQLRADALIIATDVDALYLEWGEPTQRAVTRADPEALAELAFPRRARWDRRFKPHVRSRRTQAGSPPSASSATSKPCSAETPARSSASTRPASTVPSDRSRAPPSLRSCPFRVALLACGEFLQSGRGKPADMTRTNPDDRAPAPKDHGTWKPPDLAAARRAVHRKE